MKISIINLVAFFAIVIAVEAYKEDKSFWDEFYYLQNKERDDALLVDDQIEEILEEVGFNTEGHNHRRINEITKYTLCRSGDFGKNAYPAPGYLWGEETPKSLLAVWMNSPVHKGIIQDPKHKYVGCARGRSGSNYSYICAFRGANRLERGVCPTSPFILYGRCFFQGIEKIVSSPGTYPCNSFRSCCV